MYNRDWIVKSFDFSGEVVVVTGGAGVLGREIVSALVGLGARVAVLSRSAGSAGIIENIGPDRLLTLTCDVTDRAALETCGLEIARHFGPATALINAAGGNMAGATTNADRLFFDLKAADLSQVLDLNLLGTIFACQVFARQMIEQQRGTIVNVSSMAAARPLTKIPGYACAKAGVENFTRWLAVYLAREYSPCLRVNSIAPGFILTSQNRFLLIDEESEELTERGRDIIKHTPMGRFGNPADLISTIIWLLTPSSRFITGIVVPVDGGFSAFSGV